MKKILWKAETVARRSSVKKVFLKISQNAQEKTCVGVFFTQLQDFNLHFFIKKETPAQLFLCEFCKIFKNLFFADHLRTTASRETVDFTKSEPSSYCQ